MNALFFGTFLAAMTTGVPIAIAMALGSLVYIWLSGSIPPITVVHRMVGGVDSFPLLAVPFFIFAGNLMNSAGITNRIFGFALKLVGWMKGGLGHVNIVGSVVFAGMSGTAVADAGGLGTIEIKAMKDHGYPVEFAVGITAASSTLGPIIPPSLPMVIYGVQANASIGKLFAGGFIPGVVMALLMMLMVGYYAHVRKYGADYPFTWRGMSSGLGELIVVGITSVVLFQLWGDKELGGLMKFGAPLAAILIIDKVFKFDALMALLTPVILIGGMASGLFTPTEAAVAAVFWALFLGFVWYRTLTFRMLMKISMDTIETTATVLFIVAAASIFAWVLTTTQMTEAVAQWVLSISSEPWIFLLLANIFLLFVGCFMETIAAITILVPVFMPILAQLGIDPIHFGLIMVLNLMIGLITPPVGIVIFVLSKISGLSFEKTLAAIVPWMVPLLITLLLITYIPELVLWLPNILYPE
ncbi:TRAP transporter large permease [Zeimonas arvi]|uniref:TRAP transporter large permease n=1 Tax=Zeimonas arvi TaxID=2498847 RepID=A0A5C8P692_9BURK|nr:TRAP transporter large permease [Zeimonas arvi]TXL68833.1 TRAP transporter large permease [Zeimonas arvi]